MEAQQPQRQPRPMSRESLERLLQARERMLQERQGRPSLDSTEIIRQMRDEHSQYSEAQQSQREPHRITLEAIELLRQVREEIRRNHPDTVFTDSAEIIRQMRDERSEHLAEL